MQGIIQNAHHVWNDFAPVVIPQLPFMAKHPVSHSHATIHQRDMLDTDIVRSSMTS